MKIFAIFVQLLFVSFRLKLLCWHYYFRKVSGVASPPRDLLEVTLLQDGEIER